MKYRKQIPTNLEKLEDGGILLDHDVGGISTIVQYHVGLPVLAATINQPISPHTRLLL